MICCNEDLFCLKQYKNIYIYGAGKIADSVYEIVSNMGVEIEGFVVTKEFGNPKTVKGKKVYLIYDLLEKKKDISVLVAVLFRYKREIVDTLLALNFRNIIVLSKKYTLALENAIYDKNQESFFKNTDYQLVRDSNMEVGHVVLQERNSAYIGKWRMDLSVFDEIKRMNIESFHNHRLLGEYEQKFGKYQLLSSLDQSKVDDLNIKDWANIYIIKCYKDKKLQKEVDIEYMIPLQAGAALTEEKICKLGDGTGANISCKNSDFSECSAIYWIWKNGNKKEYTGVFHYRRHLKADITELFALIHQRHDLLHTIPCLMPQTVAHFFISNFIYESDIKLMLRFIKEKAPGYFQTANTLLYGTFYLSNNVFIMKTIWFDKMCKFVFGILLDIDQYYAEINFVRQDRYAGYLFEILYSIFVMHHAKEMNIVYTDMKYFT